MTAASVATIILIGVFMLLIFLRVPVVYAIGIASLIDFFYLGINPMQMALKFVSNLNSYTLLAVPFFILMGELMSAGGITDTLIEFPPAGGLVHRRCRDGERGRVLLLRRHLRLLLRGLRFPGAHRDQDDGGTGV